MIRKLISWSLLVTGIAGMVMQSIAIWPGAQAVARAYAYAEPIQPVNGGNPWLFVGSFVLMLLSAVGLWLIGRHRINQFHDPPSSPPRYQLQLVP